MKKLLTLLIILFTVSAVSGQTMIDTAVNFSVKDIHGNNIELFPLLDEGKLVVIDFFSTSCGPCGIYAPEIQLSYEDFGENSSNVFFMSIDYGDDNDGVAYFDSIYNLTLPSVSGSQGGGKEVHNDYLIQSTPTVILIAPDRVILENYIWEPTRENINAAIIAAGGSMVGVDEVSDADKYDLLVYPNPSSGRISVEIESDGLSIYLLEVYNMPGTRVYQTGGMELTAGRHILTIDLQHLPGGTYFMRLVRNGTRQNLSRFILLD